MNKIRELRQARKWRQADLASRLNTNQQTIGRYETGVRGLDVETIHKLCDIFGCSADYLLGRSALESPVLTAEELGLLEGFRGLGPQGRAYVLQSLALASHAYSEKNDAVSDLETAN